MPLAYQTSLGNPYQKRCKSTNMMPIKKILITWLRSNRNRSKLTRLLKPLKISVFLFASLNNMMYAKSPEEFDIVLGLFNLKFKTYDVFVDYFNKLWVPKKENWSHAWSLVST